MCIYSYMREIKGIRIHFVGVGGSSLSGLIRIAKYLGAIVSGSDKLWGSNLQTLSDEGFNVYQGTNEEISSSADIVVYSSAVNTDNPELQDSKCIMERGEFLGVLSQCFKKTIAVAGTHGKSTVTAMISHYLNKHEYPFVAHIGGVFFNQNSGVILKGRELFLTEACEYKDNFLSLSPDIGIITNIEYDHPDYFPTFKSYQDSFAKFASLVKKDLIIGRNVNLSNVNVRTLALDKDFSIQCLNAHVNTYAYEDFDNRIILKSQIGTSYNLDNLAIACRCLTLLDTSLQHFTDTFSDFYGLKRRREFIGYYNTCEVYSDYAHHPTQIEKLILSFKGNKKIAVIFEPHTYSRTRELIDDFARSLSLADYLILLPVYSAREKYDEQGSSKKLYQKITIKNKIYIEKYNDFIVTLNSLNLKNALLLFVGAGSIDELARSTAVDVTS